MTDTIELKDIGHHFDAGRERTERFRGRSCTVRGDQTLAIIGPSGLALRLLLEGHRDAFNVAARWLERVGLKDRARHHPQPVERG